MCDDVPSLAPARTARGVNVIAFVAAALMWPVEPLGAHHSFVAEYETNTPVSLSGTVSRVQWTNPHAWIYLDVSRADGSKATWAVEAGAPNALVRRGWSTIAVPIGTSVLIEGYQAKDGALKVRGMFITMPDGRRLSMGAPARSSPAHGIPRTPGPPAGGGPASILRNQPNGQG